MTTSPLKGREIVLGVCGSIAAYKSADLARRFKDLGAEVTCVLTGSAGRFITPLTLGALTARPVYQDLFDERLWQMAHLTLAKSAQAVVVAPCSADFLASLAAGRSDSLLSALILAARVPVFLAPAMHEPMWTHPATQRNVKTCRSYRYHFIGPAHGALASGDKGWGRLEDPAKIAAQVARWLSGPR